MELWGSRHRGTCRTGLGLAMAGQLRPESRLGSTGSVPVRRLRSRVDCSGTGKRCLRGRGGWGEDGGEELEVDDGS